MPNKLIEETVDLHVLPQPDTSSCGGEGAEVTIGDLHGNMLKLLFLLIKQGIATNLSAEDYDKLVAIYTKQTDDLTAEDLLAFNGLLDQIIFNPGTMVRLIGDELADRGSNDYFTLKLIEKLQENQVPVEILLSNHGVEFVEAYEIHQNFHAPMLCQGHAESMEALQQLVGKGLVLRDEILSIAHKAYKPTLRVLSYTLHEDPSLITLYSHAGIGLNSIQELAAKLDLPYHDGTANELAQTIDQINGKFQRHVQDNTVHTLYQREVMYAGYSGDYLKNAPVEFVMWNRHYDDLERPELHSGYRVEFVHGHDSGDMTQSNIYNLDNNLGKRALRWMLNHQEVYSILYATGGRLRPAPGVNPELILPSHDVSHLPIFGGSSDIGLASEPIYSTGGRLSPAPGVNPELIPLSHDISRLPILMVSPDIGLASEPIYSFWLQFGAGLFVGASLLSLSVLAAGLLGVVALSPIVLTGVGALGLVAGALSYGFFKANDKPKDLALKANDSAAFTVIDMS
jgi:hypothetical protein